MTIVGCTGVVDRQCMWLKWWAGGVLFAGPVRCSGFAQPRSVSWEWSFWYWCWMVGRQGIVGDGLDVEWVVHAMHIAGSAGSPWASSRRKALRLG